MQRRTFLKYSSLGVASAIVTACSDRGSNNEPIQIEQPRPSNFDKLEKTSLTLGYVPMTDAAPLIVAQEKGFFSRYGLTVTLSKQASWEEIEKGLLEWRFDAAQALYGMPMLAQLGAKAASMVALMTLNLNGSAIALSQKAWKADIRPSIDYVNFQEFSDSFIKYIRGFQKSPNFAIESAASIENYLYRYWLAAMGIAPEKEVKFTEISPSQAIFKLQAGSIDGSCIGEPWNQDAVLKKAAFVTYASRDIWKGHPNKVLAAMQGWVDKNPTTAKALVAALIEACQFCDRPENHADVALLLAQSQYLNAEIKAIEPSLGGKYNYSQLADQEGVASIPDFNIFHYRPTDYLKQSDCANYPWRSHAVWLLTQMIRWNQIDRREYPQNADEILNKIYPTEIYEEVAKALNILLPTDKMKKEPATAFIDGREFDPSQPVAYLNQFVLRAGRSKIFALRTERD
ncbi:nitrate transport protein, NrtC-like protein [Hydrococcus rivularis NIES-593]|uniref:Nitrate transport protein, NrtC-like protein n=1 Tax=Hydrococcus rivularis NIES-593 TaxID=1921803 RepID=A0A1U7HCM8_9CYAN|nr:CmpA/NrtA family ABC transporter substrate-binding protein [Hydrococcus rivularis]OKH21314.1 nitrate transport protein, NrtC-like protein [Hydrococcus rivularis NIES-593]